jgi:hypothetical protein
MKKIIPIVFTLFTIISCEQKPIEKLKEDAEKEVVSRLNDPSSYEFVSFQEDNFEREVIKQRITDIKKQLEKAEKANNKEEILKQKGYLKATENLKLPENQMEFKIEYRAKNKFNALIIGSSKVVSDKNYKLISVTENL